MIVSYYKKLRIIKIKAMYFSLLNLISNLLYPQKNFLKLKKLKDDRKQDKKFSNFPKEIKLQLDTLYKEVF